MVFPSSVDSGEAGEGFSVVVEVLTKNRFYSLEDVTMWRWRVLNFIYIDTILLTIIAKFWVHLLKSYAN